MDVKTEKIKISELLQLRKSSILTVNPEYQRGAVWGQDQQRRLVDSILRSYPLPLIYLHHRVTTIAGIRSEQLEIIDGQQRINALYAFYENHFKLFDPLRDDKRARFPEFIKNQNCPWAHCTYTSLPGHLKEMFDNTEIFIVKVYTDKEDEARDLFIRLQAGLPLNPQEKRDAWPGGYTEFVLQTAGKKEIMRYPGHDFFRKVIYNPATERGNERTLCAQIGMLFFKNATEGNWMDIGTQAVDDFYYQNLAFNAHSGEVERFYKVLDIIVKLFDDYNGKKLKGHEAIHIVLLVNTLLDNYTRDWYPRLTKAFDEFRQQSAWAKRLRDGEYWLHYGALTQTQAAAAATLQRRHAFFVSKMFDVLSPILKDEQRGYGPLEREIVFYRDNKICAVCGYEVNWMDLEIHHLEEHQHGGRTSLENGVCVHKSCHPKGRAAIDFYEKWLENKQTKLTKSVEDSSNNLPAHNSVGVEVVYQITNEKKGILAHGIVTDNGKFCILKGSTIAAEVSASFEETSKAAAKRRINLMADGSIDAAFTFTKDVIFNSRSNAASLVLGFSANGHTSWVPVHTNQKD